MWRAVLEAIGYDYMEITDTYRASGVPLKRITVTEGGSRDSLWNQIKADMLASDVVRFRNAGGAVVTNCVFAALASGGVKDVIPALQDTIVRDASYAPNPANSELYRDLFMKKVKLVKLEAKKDPKTGRMNMTEIAGSEFEMPADVVLIAAGFLGAQEYVAKAFGVKLNARTNVETDPGEFKTSVDKVFTAGDMHRGQSLVVWGINEGRHVAKEVDKFLMGYTNLD